MYNSREGNGTPLQYSCLENPMDGGAWWAAVHEVAKSRTRLSDFTFTFHFHALEKEMATHSSVLAWRIPGTEEPGRRPSMGSHRVGHDWSDLAVAAANSVDKDIVPRTWAEQHPHECCSVHIPHISIFFIIYLKLINSKVKYVSLKGSYNMTVGKPIQFSIHKSEL